MPALNDEINALDGKVAGKVQLELYAAVQDLLLDRLVWFLRNADLSQGPGRAWSSITATASRRWRRRSTSALPKEAAAARAARGKELVEAGVPDALARRIADIPELAAAPDIVLVADRTKKPIADVAATYFAAEAYFRLDRVVAAARGIVVSDYFDRLALDRALDSIGDAERRLTAAMVATGAVRRRRRSRPGSSRARPRSSASARRSTRSRARGLTLSKLTVAASLLGDLAKE